jgi:molybdopterin converting factor small subunit
MIKIKIITYGILKEYLSPEINIKLDENSKIDDLKIILFNNFKNDKSLILKNIFDKSIFSTSTNILSDNYILKNGDKIYFLPPFSGG